jgi:hypothetical protein
MGEAADGERSGSGNAVYSWLYALFRPEKAPCADGARWIEIDLNDIEWKLKTALRRATAQ